MSDTVIRVENLGKRYIIGHQKDAHYQTLRDAITNVSRSLKNQLLKPGKKAIATSSKNEFWALKDISFEIPKGDSVALIGHNGAGKSTLLKILSRITEPTTGCVALRGRIASLLEVGTGFHPELTGRENIYLNGSVLGMSRKEINYKFDEIVAFSEINKFIDTPVKRYSSGMYVRLAFAVAANLDPEILVVDEVLAVGDSGFQQKCLLKIRELTQQGATVLFVSHNMHYIGVLAKRCIYLKSGSIIYDGNANEAIDIYLNDALDNMNSVSPLETSQQASKAEIEESQHILLSVRATNLDRQLEINSNEDLYVTLGYKSTLSSSKLHFQVTLWTEQGVLLTCADSRLSNQQGFSASEQGEVTCIFPSISLITGRYLVKVYMLNADTDWSLCSFGWSDGRVCSFSVKPQAAMMTTGMIWYPNQSDYGLVQLPFNWQEGDKKASWVQ